MKRLVFLVVGLSCSLTRAALAAEPPRGTVLELHSCALYAGGCIVSSEATLGGRYMLRAWDFAGGTFAGADLAGLRLALLQSAAENLAEPTAEPGQAVVYLPETATPAQREVLLHWLASTQPGLKPATLKTRVVPLQFAKTESGYSFKAGDFVSVTTASLESCETGACGESLWYAPRAATSLFTVAVDQASQVTEPLLELKWNDAGKRSVFLGKFGGDAPARNLYVTAADLCGPSGVLF
jgi:hypothetical protein